MATLQQRDALFYRVRIHAHLDIRQVTVFWVAMNGAPAAV